MRMSLVVPPVGSARPSLNSSVFQGNANWDVLQINCAQANHQLHLLIALHEIESICNGMGLVEKTQPSVYPPARVMVILEKYFDI